MKHHPVLFALFVLLLTVLTSCKEAMVNDASPGRVVAISIFKCNCDPSIQETVQNTFIDAFFRTTNAKPTKGEKGDIVIVGLLTMGQGSTHTAKESRHSSSGESASGTYMNGITVQAYKNGELIATYSDGQDLEGGRLPSPVSLAQKAARYMSSALVKKNEIGRQQ